jgi:hypothetical protein
MPILIRDISRERREINALALGKIHYSEIEKHLVEERSLEGLAYKEFMDARDAFLSFAGSPAEIRQIVALVRNLGRQQQFGPTAVLVSTDFAFGVMNAMECLVEDVADIKPFREEVLARSWLAAMPLDKK